MLKRRTWPACTAGLAVTVLTGAAGLAGASAAAAGSRPQPARAAPGAAAMSPAAAVPRIPPGATVTGPEAGSARLHITVALRSAHPRGLDRLATEVSTPGSARFRHFLGPRRIRARFGPPGDATVAVRTWLRSEGLAPGRPWGTACCCP